MNIFVLFAVSNVLLTLTSFLYKLIFWTLMFPGETVGIIDLFDALIWGMRYDFAVSGFFSFLLVIIAQVPIKPGSRKLLWAYFAFSFFILFLFSGNYLYYLDSGRHVSYEVKHFFRDGKGLFMQTWNAYRELFAIFAVLVVSVSAGGMLILKKMLRRYPYHPHRGSIPIRAAKGFAVNFLLLIVSMLIIRGGWEELPLEPFFVYKIGNPAKADIAVNGAYNAVYSFVTKDGGKIKNLNIPTLKADRMKSVMKSVFPDHEAVNQPEAFRAKNIVMLFLESWSDKFMEDPGVAPNFGKLKERSIYPSLMLAGGRRTTEGMFSSLCSWQNPLGGSVAQSKLQYHKFHCLPSILVDKGYDSIFIQGGCKNTSGVGVFAQKLGFVRSDGIKDIKKITVEKNGWGAHDIDIYGHAFEFMKESKRPFLIGINTNTTHDVHLPPSEPRPFKLDRENALHYADKALGLFLERFEREHPKDFKNTLFVFVSDHTAGIKGNFLEKLSIPFIMFASDLTPRRIETVAHQRDITPSVLDYLGLKIPQNFTGRSLIAIKDNEGTADLYYGGNLGWIERGNVSVVNLFSNDYNCYKYGSDLNPIPCKCTPFNDKLKEKVIVFTDMSQKLLFDDKVLDYTKPEDLNRLYFEGKAFN